MCPSELLITLTIITEFRSIIAYVHMQMCKRRRVKIPCFCVYFLPGGDMSGIVCLHRAVGNNSVGSTLRAS